MAICITKSTKKRTVHTAINYVLIFTLTIHFGCARNLVTRVIEDEINSTMSMFKNYTLDKLQVNASSERVSDALTYIGELSFVSIIGASINNHTRTSILYRLVHINDSNSRVSGEELFSVLNDQEKTFLLEKANIIYNNKMHKKDPSDLVDAIKFSKNYIEIILHGDDIKNDTVRLIIFLQIKSVYNNTANRVNNTQIPDVTLSNLIFANNIPAVVNVRTYRRFELIYEYNLACVLSSTTFLLGNDNETKLQFNQMLTYFKITLKNRTFEGLMTTAREYEFILDELKSIFQIALIILLSFVQIIPLVLNVPASSSDYYLSTVDNYDLISRVSIKSIILNILVYLLLVLYWISSVQYFHYYASNINFTCLSIAILIFYILLHVISVIRTGIFIWRNVGIVFGPATQRKWINYCIILTGSVLFIVACDLFGALKIYIICSGWPQTLRLLLYYKDKDNGEICIMFGSFVPSIVVLQLWLLENDSSHMLFQKGYVIGCLLNTATQICIIILSENKEISLVKYMIQMYRKRKTQSAIECQGDNDDNENTKLMELLQIPSTDDICSICMEGLILNISTDCYSNNDTEINNSSSKDDDSAKIYSTDQYIKETTCRHIFHGICISNWVHLNKSCPICRTNFSAIEVERLTTTTTTNNYTLNRHDLYWMYFI
jgi:hypothetical protein